MYERSIVVSFVVSFVEDTTSGYSDVDVLRVLSFKIFFLKAWGVGQDKAHNFQFRSS